MLKKTIGSLIVASALTISLGAVDSEASQWNDSTIDQNQTNSGWTKIIQKQMKEINDAQSQFNGPSGKAQGQAVFVKGFQLQSGKSNGPATATQSEDRTIDVGDEQNGTTTTTIGNGSTESTTSTSGAAHVLQAQSTTNAVFHFQGSIEGGPSLQNQISQTHSYQFSTAVSK